MITTVAGNGIGGLSGGFSGDGGPATSAQLSAPTGIAVDSAGNLYIAEYGNNRIRKVSNGVITTVAGNGTLGYSGDNGPATSAELARPEGVAVDAAGNLYIADSFNNRIRKVANGVITTVAGNGTAGFSGDNGPATSAELNFPEGVAVDSAGNLYIADSSNNRIRILTIAPLPTITKVTNAASYATGAVSPGEIISIFANASSPIGPTPYVQLSSANCPSPCTNVPTTMGGVQVEFLPQGVFAPLLYVSATQINAVVPYEIQSAGSSVSVEVLYLGQVSNAFVLQTATTAPGIITLLGTGTGTAAMNQYDTSGNYQGINSGSNPASPGWVLVMYVTGEGTIPSPVDGSVISSINIKPVVGPPAVLIDDTPSTMQYYGEAYGIVSGVLQVNVQIPTGIRTSQADSLFLTIGGNTTQSGVTVQIK